MADISFFTESDGWFLANDAARGPWDPEACHGGPPAGLLARASENEVPDQRLTRMSLEFSRPIPMAGFRIDTAVVRRGRSVSVTQSDLLDRSGKVCATARSLHIRETEAQGFPSVSATAPSFDFAEPGSFPMVWRGHEYPWFSAGVEARFEPNHHDSIGPTTMWMRSLNLLPEEEMSPFQTVCPVADCGNASSRNAEPHVVSFVNPDLTINVFREPVGPWIGSSAVSYWEPNGIGLADAELFDKQGLVGRSTQTLLLRFQIQN